MGSSVARALARPFFLPPPPPAFEPAAGEGCPELGPGPWAPSFGSLHILEPPLDAKIILRSHVLVFFFGGWGVGVQVDLPVGSRMPRM